MIYDLPPAADYSEAIETSARKLRDQIARRDAAMVVIEASRRSPVSLPTDIYIMFKIIHGNAEAEVRRWASFHRDYCIIYHGPRSDGVKDELLDMTVRPPSLEQLWLLWRNVLAARAAYRKIPDEVLTDCWGCEPVTITSKEKLDALLVVERAERLYDKARRAYDGRDQLTVREVFYRPRPLRLTKPTRSLPPKRVAKPKPLRKSAVRAALLMETT